MHIFYHNHPGIIKVVLNFLEFTSVCKKSAQFIHSSTHSIVNFISDIRIYNYKKIQFSKTEINIEIKTTATAVIKNELKYFLISEGNTCIAEPNLEVLPLT